MARTDLDYTTLRGILENTVRVRTLLERLVGPSSAKVLEIGVRGGDATEGIAQRFQDVTCLDLSEENLAVTRRRLLEQGLPAPRCVVARTEDASFGAGSFDHIFMLNILEHIEDPPVALERVRPWIADDGTVHIVVNLATSLHRRLGLKMGVIGDLSALAESDHRLGHYRVYTPEQLREHVTAASFAVTYERPFYLKPLPTSMLSDLPWDVHEALRLLGTEYPQFAGYVYMEARKAQSG